MADITPFIVIGNRGTALPLGLRDLPPSLSLGSQDYQWSAIKPTALDSLLNAWVAKKGSRLTLLERAEALNSCVLRQHQVSWNHSGLRYSGTAFLPSYWTIEEKVPQYVAVDCPEWKHGVVETKSLGSRNAQIFARLEFDLGATQTTTTTWVPYLTEDSEFAPPVEQALSEQRPTLERGQPVELQLNSAKDGYAGERIVSVVPSNMLAFETNVLLKTWTRSPARIRAAATVIRDLKLFGLFQVSHNAGALRIQWLQELDASVQISQVATVPLPTALEGARKLVTHLRIERKPGITRAKKAHVLRELGCLKCECCPFDFAEVYGAKGEEFCEVHHRQPLHELDEVRETALEDLAIVCANCHRMLHRGPDFWTVEELRAFFVSRKVKTA